MTIDIWAYLIAVPFTLVVCGAIWMGICEVPEGQAWVIERLGRYSSTIWPGLHFVAPMTDQIRRAVTIKDAMLDVEPKPVITRDNVILMMDALAIIKVEDPYRAVYGITNYEGAVGWLVLTTLRAVVGTKDMDEVFAQRREINEAVQSAIVLETERWGVTVRGVEIQGIEPSQDMASAMMVQAISERDRRGSVIMAEGAKEVAIINADARLAAAVRDSKARVKLAEASADSIAAVADSMGDNTEPMKYLLGQQYVAAMQDLAASPNSKLVLLPADIQDALGGMMRPETLERMGALDEVRPPIAPAGALETPHVRAPQPPTPPRGAPKENEA